MKALHYHANNKFLYYQEYFSQFTSNIVPGTVYIKYQRLYLLSSKRKVLLMNNKPICSQNSDKEKCWVY